MFDCGPSSLMPVYWSNTLVDLQWRLKLRFGFEHARLVQGFENLALVVSQALGGGDKKGGPRRPPPDATPVDNEHEALARWAAVMGG